MKNEEKTTLILTTEEGEWLGFDEGTDFFEKHVQDIVFDNNNWHPHDNMIDVTKSHLEILLKEMKRIMLKCPPTDMEKYRQTTDIAKIDEELDGADYRLAESIAKKIETKIKEIKC